MDPDGPFPFEWAAAVFNFKDLFAVVVSFGKFFGDVGNRGVYEFAKIFFEVGGKIFDERGIGGTVIQDRPIVHECDRLCFASNALNDSLGVVHHSNPAKERRFFGRNELESRSMG
ncbi:MAG: hypothetical protein M3Y57_01045 [Acidobacteriota bacterium]|nr:hypothetical protein [Acidobacteriota bacterium]